MTSSTCSRVPPPPQLTFNHRSDVKYSGDRCNSGHFTSVKTRIYNPTAGSFKGTLSSLIYKFPPNYARQLCTKSRRNCSNIGVSQVVDATWSTNASEYVAPVAGDAVDLSPAVGDADVAEFCRSDGSVAIHAGTFINL